MIRCQLRVLIAQKEIEEGRRIPYSEISKATGISPSALAALANNQVTRYYASTLDRLCKFFNCGVGDILVYTPNHAPDA